MFQRKKGMVGFQKAKCYGALKSVRITLPLTVWTFRKLQFRSLAPPGPTRTVHASTIHPAKPTKRKKILFSRPNWAHKAQSVGPILGFFLEPCLVALFHGPMGPDVH